MANNRVSLQCKTCGQKILLAKYYPSTGWGAYSSPSGTELFEFLDVFVDSHGQCAIEDEDLITGGNPFVLEYEHTEQS